MMDGDPYLSIFIDPNARPHPRPPLCLATDLQGSGGHIDRGDSSRSITWDAGERTFFVLFAKTLYG
jgi:hypothetical protein